MANKPKPKAIVDTTEDDNFDLFKSIASEVNSKLKSNAIMIGEDGSDTSVPYWVKTGIPQLDYAVGGKSHPGFPGGRFIEIFGGEGSGKSTLALHITKKAIDDHNAFAVYQDAERVLTDEIIEGTQINMSRVGRSQPDTLEEVFDAQEAILDVLKQKFPDNPVAIVMDSIASCSTKSEIEGDMEDAQMAPHARLMSKGLRKIKDAITSSSVLSIWINQTREKMNVSFGDNTATFGGKAMAFYASVRIQLVKIQTIKESSGKVTGARIKATIKKNKVAPPLKTAEYIIEFIETDEMSYPRIDVHSAVLEWLKEYDVIGGSAGRYELEVDGKPKSMYLKEAKKYLQDNPEYFEELTEKAYHVFDKEDAE